MEQPPELITISLDDDYAQYVGRMSDGRQFFVTQPFEPRQRDFVVAYLFAASGEFIEAKIQDLGPRAAKCGVPPGNALVDEESVQVLQEKLIIEFSQDQAEIEFCDIQVRPFSYQSHGTTFGLVLQPPEQEDEEWTVTAEPGNYMAFFPPWDGEYDT